MSEVILIAGVSRYLGARLAAAFAADPAVERVIGIDTVPPPEADLVRLGRTEFVRADIRNPLIAKGLAQARVTTVVHAALIASPRSAGGRVSMQEMNVIGTMQLLAACQKSENLRRVVLRSTTAVYGCRSADPAVFTEDMHPAMSGRAGFAKDAAEVEGYVRGFARRRPDIDVSVLRLADVLGPAADSAMARYLRAPLVPTPLGFDPRIQLLHEVDAVEALRLASVSSRPGVVNVAAKGVLPLSQVVRRAGRVRVPTPGPALTAVGALVGNPAVAEITAERPNYLSFGCAVDTTRLHTEFGYSPRYTTGDAIDTLGSASRRPPAVTRVGLGVGSRLLDSSRGRVSVDG